MSTLVPEPESVLAGVSPEQAAELYRRLLLPRLIEEKMLILLRQGKLSKWFSGIGQEAIAVGVASALDAEDVILPMHRNLGVFTTRGVDLPRLLRQLLGKSGGFTAGRDRTFHFGTLEHHIIGMISHLGAMLPVADGVALAHQLRGSTAVVASFIGEGATSEGDFHEALNLAAVWKLPVIFVIENNYWGLSTPVSEQYACARLTDRGVGYGVRAQQVDGNDVGAVLSAVRTAAERARRGEGPTLLECLTFRMRGHEEASGTAYVPPEMLEEWAAKDPILRFERRMAEGGLTLPADLKPALKAQIDTLVDEALAAPDPDSTAERELNAVFAPRRDAAVESGGSSAPPTSVRRTDADRDLRYVDAIADGLREAMRRDPRVVLIGQDIAEYGGVFKITEGLVEEFGKARVRNTPIVESAAIGAALGLALEGFVPMVEMQFADFISCAFNQIVNNVAKTHYRWGARVPMVIRAPSGGGTGAGPFHSQNVEAWFAHVAGLKIVAPATPRDAKGLLLAAFEDGNPVLYLEHKRLYRSARGRVPVGYYTTPIGEARIARAGRDATVVTYGAGVQWALDAAHTLEPDGHSIEVIDLRTIVPWDRDRVLASVRRTSRALVLHEAPLTAGFGAEIAAVIADAAFDALDAPVTRLAALDTPIPFSKKLEAIVSPRGRIVPALRALLSY